MGKLYENGALEVHYTPVYMKKNRPGAELVVICDNDTRGKLERIIFTETTTTGIRRINMKRSILPRTCEVWDTPRGQVAVKRITLPDGSERIEPEYDSVVEMTERTDSSYSECLSWLSDYIRSQNGGGGA